MVEEYLYEGQTNSRGLVDIEDVKSWRIRIGEIISKINK